MAKRKTLQIGTLHFPTKKALRDFVRVILYRYQIGERLGGSDELFMCNLFERHPDYDTKCGVGIAAIHVRQNTGSRGFWITRVDGTETDISFLCCITAPTHEHEVRAAMRVAIRAQITEFKRGAPLHPVCAVTGEPLTEGSCHVDHKVPFDQLLRSFMREKGLSFENISVEPTRDGETDTLLVDSQLEAEWDDYHRSHAVLRLVTANANLSLLRRSPR